MSAFPYRQKPVFSLLPSAGVYVTLLLAIVAMLLCSNRTYGQKFRLRKARVKGKFQSAGVKPVKLAAGAKIYHSSAEFKPTHTLNVNPQSANQTVKFFWDVAKVKVAQGVRWQVSRIPFAKPRFRKLPAAQLTGVVKTGTGNGKFGSFLVDFQKLKTRFRKGTLYVRVLPIAKVGTVGLPSNVLKVYYGNGPKQPPTKLPSDYELFVSRLEQAFKGNVVGYQIVVRKTGEKTRRLAGGLARTYANAPKRTMSINDRMNIGSITKTITTVAVLQLLKKRKLSINSKVSPYLPKHWKLGPNVKSITFNELLTHRAGIRSNSDSYSRLRAMIAFGVKLENKSKYEYRNPNFSLMRIVIPYLNGYKPSDKPFLGTKDNKIAYETATNYRDYVNTYVFKPAGIPTARLKPYGHSVLYYPFPAGNTRGLDFGNAFMIAAAGGWHLTADELMRFSKALKYSTKLLPATWRKKMYDHQLGIYRKSIKYGHCHTHNGGLLNGDKTIQMNSVRIDFSEGTQVVVILNSKSPTWLEGLVIDVFNKSRGL